MSEKKIRVATKKMMAYPKDEQYEDNYELHRCLHCKQEYLSQGIIEEEFDFCPLHIGFKDCVDCGTTAEKSEMSKIGDNEFYCSDCDVPRCTQCDKPLESIKVQYSFGQYCSLKCKDEQWLDLVGDDE